MGMPARLAPGPLPRRAICLHVPRETLEKRSSNSSNAAPLVAIRQYVPLGPIVEGVLYGWWYGYVCTGISRALLYTSWQTLGKHYVTQTLDKPCELYNGTI